MREKEVSLNQDDLMKGFGFKRTILACFIFGAISPFAISALAPFFLLFIDAFRPLFESMIEAIGLANTNIAFYKLGVDNLKNTVLSLFISIFPYDFTNINVTENDVFFVLTISFFTLMLCAAASRIAHSSALGLRAETIKDVEKRGFEAKMSSIFAFFRAVWFIPFIMSVLYIWVALQPVADGFSREFFEPSDFIKNELDILNGYLPIVLSAIILFLFLQWVAKLQSILVSILITFFTLIFWSMLGEIANSVMRSYDLTIPFVANSLQNAYALAIYTIPGFIAYILATIIAGIIIKFINNNLRGHTPKNNSPHWIRKH